MSYAFTAAAVVALVGSYANYRANTMAANRQDSALAQELRQQGQLQQQAAADTNQLIQKTQQSNPDQAKSSLLASFTDQLNKSRGRAITPLSQAGAVSDAYTKAANDAASGISDFGNTNANLLSSIDAPAVQRQGELANLSRYGTAIGGLKQQSAADDFLTQMRLRSITPNPWLQAFGSAANGAASAIASRSGSGGFGGAANGGGSVSYSGGYGTNLPFK